MYKFSIKRNTPNMERIMDGLIDKPYVIIKDKSSVQALGIYGRALRKRKILHISPDDKLGESVALLKINNYIKPKSVQKKKGKTIDYLFYDADIPKV